MKVGETLRDIAEHSTEGRVIYNGRERAGAKRNTGIAVSRYPERESEHKENPPRLGGYINKERTCVRAFFIITRSN